MTVDVDPYAHIRPDCDLRVDGPVVPDARLLQIGLHDGMLPCPACAGG